ncbi:MAG TPA: hypothetical protein VNG71_22615 [Pyrinomonadaceae bacterium]|nr:hypothetical protein [Pyrinomonadaceae bacterium]
MPLTVSNPILTEIGRITVYQTHTEAQMGLFIQELLYLDDAKGHILTSGLRVNELVDMLGALLANEFGPSHQHVARFKQFSKALDKLRLKRNEIVHSMWSFGPTLNVDTATRSKIKRSGREFATVTLSEMQELSKTMEHLEWEIGDIRVRVCHYEESSRPAARNKPSK